jgi:uncharacterized protein YciI
MPVHLCKLLPPRATFPGDMTPFEASLMREHAAYWTKLAAEGTALVVGPVLDPAGVWGVAIVDVSDIDAASAVTGDDPVIRSGSGFRYEIHPIPQAILRPNLQPHPL